MYLIWTATPYWFTIYSKRYLKGTPELNKQYWPFARNDYKDWKPIQGLFINAILLFPFRTLACWIIVMLICLVSVTMMIGFK